MDISGQLKVKYDTQKVSEKFQKRDFVLATDLSTPYPQFVSFQVNQDKCNILDNLNIGDELKVSFNLKGREWSSPQGIKYFNTIEAWRIDKIGNSSNSNSQQNQSMNDSHQAPVFNSSIDDQDDLPF